MADAAVRVQPDGSPDVDPDGSVVEPTLTASTTEGDAAPAPAPGPGPGPALLPVAESIPGAKPLAAVESTLASASAAAAPSASAAAAPSASAAAAPSASAAAAPSASAAAAPSASAAAAPSASAAAAPSASAAAAPSASAARRPLGPRHHGPSASEDASAAIGGGPPEGSACTQAQLRRFIKSRPYVPMHELRRRFELNGEAGDVPPGASR